MQNLSVSTVLIGVFAAYLVNVVTSLFGIEFDGTLHFILYVTNICLSLFAFLDVMKLYSLHVEIKENSDPEARSVHVSNEFNYYKKNRATIKCCLYRILVLSVLLILILGFSCYINNTSLRMI